MKIEKMHGCGNDFCILDYDEKTDYEKLAVRLCHRKTGIGSDGMIIVKRNPLEMIFYNADGSKAPMCGNGIRCFSRYCLEHGYIKRNKFEVLTGAGKMTVEIVTEYPFMCRVNMGSPIFKNSMIYVSDDLDSFGRVLRIEDMNIPIYSFFMGTVHTVVFVPDFESELLSHAEEICNHRLFTKKTNVNFVQVIDKNTLRVKTFERGVGWTLACGTGCCASAVAAQRLGLSGKGVRVMLELGFLDIELKKNEVYMTGPAVKVFACEYEEEIKC